MGEYITKKDLIKLLAEELAYNFIEGCLWYYCIKNGDGVDDEFKEKMARMHYDDTHEIRVIANYLGILKEVYDEAYKIYDFRGCFNPDFIPDKELILKLDRDFCYKKQENRLIC